MEQITKDQWEQIRIIQEVLGIIFTGQTIKEAGAFIKKYSKWVDEYLDDCIF